MELYWGTYSGKTKPQNRLFLYLGESDSKYCFLDSEKISEDIKNRIKKNSDKLDKADMEHKVAWIRENCPGALSAYRTVKKNNFAIMKKYAIKS